MSANNTFFRNAGYRNHVPSKKSNPSRTSSPAKAEVASVPGATTDPAMPASEYPIGGAGNPARASAEPASGTVKSPGVLARWRSPVGKGESPARPWTGKGAGEEETAAALMGLTAAVTPAALRRRESLRGTACWSPRSALMVAFLLTW